MKDKLCTAPCLAYPEYTKEFNLEVVCLEDMSLSKKGHIPLVKIPSTHVAQTEEHTS